MPPAKGLFSSATAAAPPLRYRPLPSGAVEIAEAVPSADADRLSDMEEWHLACRIAASKLLCRSDLLPRFLLHICEQTLMGNSHNISEQRIGIHIFNRPTDYNPGEDNIVRSYARTLRKRMDEYFESEGSHETLRIVIPRGGYVPIFVTNTDSGHQDPGESHRVPAQRIAPITGAVESGTLPLAKLGVQRMERGRSQWAAWLKGLICLLMGCALGAFAWSATHRADDGKTPDLAHPIWAELFQKDRNTL